MEEIKKKKKFFFIINNNVFLITSANIYLSNCKTVERKNDIKSLSFVFSFERENIVINKINNNKVKYKIKISKINNKKTLNLLHRMIFLDLSLSQAFLI